jgi:hypothetical protein
MGKIDLIDVVSGDVATSQLRIEKALQRYHDSGASVFVLNGFNTSANHDDGFEGESWRDDERLIDIYKELEKLNPSVLYARNTIENGLRLREFISGNKIYSETVTSRTHLPRLKKMYWYVFPNQEYNNLSFSTSKEPNGTYLKRTILEGTKILSLKKLMSGIERGSWDIDKQYAIKRYGK